MFERSIREVEAIVREQNEWRLSRAINLIASENVMSNRARGLLGSDFAHRYAEGHPGERYYQGTQHIDMIETAVKEHLKVLFNCSHAEVRPISGTNANEAVFSTVIQAGEAVVVNSLPAGGHISHQKLGTVGKYTQRILYFPLTSDGYRIDVEKSKDLIAREKPRVLVLGKSLFLFPEPVRELAEVAKEQGIFVVYDGAHVLGLVAGKRFQDPLAEGADVVTGSMHKTFPGPQRGIILSNLSKSEWIRIDKGAFPGSSSNHHLDTLGPLLVTTYEMLAFAEAYAAQTVANAQELARELDRHGISVEGKEFGFTQSHQVAVDMSRYGGGAKVAILLRNNDMILNMNLLPRETRRNLPNPAGVRMGVQEMTRLGMREPEMAEIARLVKECVLEEKYVRPEVNRLREKFRTVRFSYDQKPAETRLRFFESANAGVRRSGRKPSRGTGKLASSRMVNL